MRTIEDIASELRNDGADVQLLYAFNSVGKTRLSVAYKNTTKDDDGTHAGIYYNAYSEDLFVWNNDIEHGEADIRLTVLPSSLSRLHADLSEFDIRAKLKPYRPSFDFRFIMHQDAEKGIESISFFPADTQPGDGPPMKISRGEERVFVWCFFLAMMEVEGWADKQPRHNLHRRSRLKPRRPQYLRDRIDVVRPDREALRRTEDHHCYPSCRDVLHPVRLVDEGREKR